MKKITQIPTECNVTNLFKIYSEAWHQRNAGMPVSEREVRLKEIAYLRLDFEFEKKGGRND